jgi:hypothetical protein
MGRWPTIRRNKSLRPPSPSPSLQAREGRGHRGGDQDPPAPPQTTVQPPRLHASASQDSVGRDEQYSLHDLCEDEDGRWHELTNRHKAAIRAIRKVRLFSHA